MSWVKENCVSFFQLLCIKIVKTGRVPQHLAIIMDGNRRFAKKHSVERSTGHDKGFDKLSETLKWCLDLGIPEVTVYAFSIENFKRSKEEVDHLMELCRKKFQRLLDDIDQINEWGICIHISGNLSLLPDDIQSLVSRAMLITRKNSKLHLNIAFAYTARDEITRAASWILEGVNNNDLNPEDIDADLVSHVLDLGEPELLIRTSGEVRLSDFMLWQVSNTVLYFTDVLWPEFSIWNLLSAIIHFQRNAPPVGNRHQKNDSNKLDFLVKLETKRMQELEKFARIAT